MRRYSKALSVRFFLVAFVVGVAGAPLQAVTSLPLAGELTINGAIWSPFNPETSTGTGVFDPFVRIQNNGTEEGYNTDADPLTGLPDVKPGVWTHSLQLGSPIPGHDAPIVNEGGVNYREFLLDVDQVGSSDGKFLSIDQMQIWLESTGNLSGAGPAALAGGTKIYDLDGGAGGDVSIIVDASLFAPGSGNGDVRVLILDSLFAGHDGDFVYLFSHMGDLNASNDGFEEWGVRVGERPPTIPAPGAMLLASMGIGLVGWLRQRRSL